MKITRKHLRKIILSEIKKDSPFRKTIEDSKDNPKKKYYYFSPKEESVYIIINGLIEKTITNVEVGSREYLEYSIGRVPVSLKNLLVEKLQKQEILMILLKNTKFRK